MPPSPAPSWRDLPWLAELGSPLLTDLYQLKMLKAYLAQGMLDDAVFEFFVRRLPEQRNFLVAAGLEQLMEILETFGFSDAELRWLEENEIADEKLLRYLRDFRFAGDVYAVPEGTVVFANEPLVRVVAPLPQAQLIESRLVNLLNFQTLIATKAARCSTVADGKLLVDFGMRRAHGAEAAVLAARAAYVGGFHGTATVLAGRLFDIPLYGTMAHSFVQAHDNERQAFEYFANSQPDNVVLLIDTYETIAGAREVLALLPLLRESGIRVRAVRLDSGDLIALSREVRAVFDAGGGADIQIFASGGLNEVEIERIVAAQAPIDGFGVGTDLDVSADAPKLDCAYKLQEYAGRARRKRSAGKATWPGRKQVYRHYRENGTLAGDTVGLDAEELPGAGLLKPMMLSGQRVATREPLDQLQQRCRESLQQLPTPLKSLSAPANYPVDVSAAVRALADETDRGTTC